MTDSTSAARPDGTGRPSSLQHYRVVHDTGDAVDLDAFLEPANLERRCEATAAHLTLLSEDSRQVRRTAWALVALNAIGWTLCPAIALTASGMRPRTGWAAALTCSPGDDVGPVDVLVDADAIRLAVDHGVGADEDLETAALIELSEVLMSGLRDAGCPPGQATSGLGSSLGTLARQAGPESRTAGLCRRVWAFFSPKSRMPGDPEFRRPACCGLMVLAHTDAAACGDCPHR